MCGLPLRISYLWVMLQGWIFQTLVSPLGFLVFGCVSKAVVQDVWSPPLGFLICLTFWISYLWVSLQGWIFPALVLPFGFLFLGCISKYVFLDVWSPPSEFLYVCVFLKDGSLDPWCALVNVLCKVVSPRIGFEIVGIPFRISYARSYFKGLWVSYLWWYSKGWLLFLRMRL